MVTHEIFLTAYQELNTLADVRRLAESGTLGLSYDALQCILAQKLVVLSKRDMRHHRDAAHQYVQRFQAGESLIHIAESVGLSPTQLARVVLEVHLGAKKGKEVMLIPKPSFFGHAGPRRTSLLCRRVLCSKMHEELRMRDCAHRWQQPSNLTRTMALTSTK